MSTTYEQAITAITDTSSMVAFLRDQLGWEIHEVYAATQLTAKVAEGMPEIAVSVRRLRPLSGEDQYSIYFVEFDQGYKRRDLRALLASVKRQEPETGHAAIEETIYIVSQGDYKDVRFVLFRSKERGQPEIRSFGWKKGEPLGRTLLEFNLPNLHWEFAHEWAKAWDVEALTKAFFTEISDLFFDTSELLASALPDENDRRLFVQTLFNRLIFLRFVEQKGWMQFGDRKDYLQALWEAGRRTPNPLWPTRLNALFTAVNHPSGHAARVACEPLVGNVPYLNGGLFEDDTRFVNPAITIPDSIFEKLLGPDGLFYRYNFTVEESTPLDVQVAVDPEILGKIFERLTTSGRRHDTGSYYTPRGIVQFMCREALVGYLSGKGLPGEKARALVYDHETSTLTNDEGNNAFQALKTIKVVDPACGSGAYLLGMLQELYALFALLKREDRRFSQEAAKEEHDRKLHIIENNIYGVDLQAFATNTAMLRLWLTLLVEDFGESPQPLPNLEYKIEVGDALLGPDPSEAIDWSRIGHAQQRGLDFESIHDTVEELRRLRAIYQDAHGPEKITHRNAFEAKLAELRKKVTGSPTKDPAKFDWRVEFFDVFLGDPEERLPGFDISLANPPYVNAHVMSNNDEYRNNITQTYETAIGAWDLYVPFWERSMLLTTSKGIATLITPNKWLSVNYGSALRTLLAGRVLYLSDLTRFRAFENVGVAAVICSASKVPTLRLSVKQHIDDGSADEVHSFDHDILERLPHWGVLLSGSHDRILRMEERGTRLSSMTTVEEAFTVDEAYRLIIHIVDDQIAEGAFKLVNTGTIDPYCSKWGRQRTRYLKNQYQYPVVPKQTLGALFPRRFEQASSKKIVTSGMRHFEAVYDSEGELLAGISTVVIRNFVRDTRPEYVLAVLNSEWIKWYLQECFRSQSIDGGINFTKHVVGAIPIPAAAETDSVVLGELAQELASGASGEQSREQRAEIDARVEFLYFHRGEWGTRENEAGETVPYPDTYDEWIAKRAAHAESAAGELMALIQGGESSTVEFKQSLEFVDSNSPKLQQVPEPQRAAKLAEAQKAVIHSALKTICSFLNAKGGTLLVGVHDNGTVMGIEPDYALLGQDKDQNPDGWERKFRQLMDSRLTPRPVGLVEMDFVELAQGTVARIQVTPSREPRYLDNTYYTRDGNRTITLESTERDAYISQRREELT